MPPRSFRDEQADVVPVISLFPAVLRQSSSLPDVDSGISDSL